MLDGFTGAGFTVLTDGPGPAGTFDADERALPASIGAVVVPLYPHDGTARNRPAASTRRTAVHRTCGNADTRP